MLWARMVAYFTGTVNQQLLLQNEYLGAEGRLLLSEGEKNDHLLFKYGVRP